MSLGSLSDADFLAMVNALLATVSADLASYPPLDATDVTALGDGRDDFADKLLDQDQKQEAARASTISKNASRDALILLIRSVRDRVKANDVNPAKYAALGIPQAESNLPATATIPIGTVDTRERLRHTINLTDAANPGNKRRPRGTDGCEIWVKIGDPVPGSSKDCVFLTLDTRTPHVVEFDPADAGKTAHYMLRWQLRDGSKSAWSETISATITG